MLGCFGAFFCFVFFSNSYYILNSCSEMREQAAAKAALEMEKRRRRTPNGECFFFSSGSCGFLLTRGLSCSKISTGCLKKQNKKKPKTHQCALLKDAWSLTCGANAVPSGRRYISAPPASYFQNNSAFKGRAGAMISAIFLFAFLFVFFFKGIS